MKRGENLTFGENCGETKSSENWKFGFLRLTSFAETWFEMWDHVFKKSTSALSVLRHIVVRGGYLAANQPVGRKSLLTNPQILPTSCVDSKRWLAGQPAAIALIASMPADLCIVFQTQVCSNRSTSWKDK